MQILKKGSTATGVVQLDGFPAEDVNVLGKGGSTDNTLVLIDSEAGNSYAVSSNYEDLEKLVDKTKELLEKLDETLDLLLKTNSSIGTIPNVDVIANVPVVKAELATISAGFDSIKENLI